MVLKRKLPTQEKKLKEKKIEEQSQDFDMELGDSKSKKQELNPSPSHDLGEDVFSTPVEDAPEDFIPAELQALEENQIGEEEISSSVQQQAQEESIKVAEQEPTSEFDDAFDMSIDDEPNQQDAPVDMVSDFDNQSAKAEHAAKVVHQEKVVDLNEGLKPVDFDHDTAEADLDLDTGKTTELESFEDLAVPEQVPEQDTQPVSFDSEEPVDWNKIASNNSNDDAFDSFESSTSWEDNKVEIKTEISEERFNQKEAESAFEDDSNFGVVPELPGMNSSDDLPEFMSSEAQEMSLNSDAKKKLVVWGAVAILGIGGVMVYSNMDKTNEVANRWAGAMSEAPQEVPESQEEQTTLLEEGQDITQAESVIDLSQVELAEDISVLDSSKEDNNQVIDSELLLEEQSPETEINLLEPEVIEKTASGKEIITAKGDEEMPEDVKEGVNLINSIAHEIEKQKAEKGSVINTIEEDDGEHKGKSAADLNQKVDEQLAQYRKLLASEENPGKKVKPANFFSGGYNQGGLEASSSPVKVKLADSKVNKVAVSNPKNAPAGYVTTAKQVDGHQIVAYPQGVARQPDTSIRTLDHFRSLMVEKQDKRVRMPKGVTPQVKNQGFPQFKVLSIVPNYGLIGEYDGRKGILIIGDSFKGCELVGVYNAYAEFKSDTRKHIITLR